MLHGSPLDSSLRGSRRTGQILLRRLSALSPINELGRDALLDMDTFAEHAAGEVLCDERRSQAPGFLVSGWAAWERRLPDHRRQIVRFLLPGDSLGLDEGPRDTSGLRAVALTRLTVLDASILPPAFAAGDPQWRTVGEALAEGGRRFERQLVDHIVRLGRQTAVERISHLLLELRDRLKAADLGSDTEFPLPLTQEMLADATGLSNVHVNRTLQQLRRDRLLDLRYGIAVLLRPDDLEALADYRCVAGGSSATA
jgi:CRP-like cAMP-binding protein